MASAELKNLLLELGHLDDSNVQVVFDFGSPGLGNAQLRLRSDDCVPSLQQLLGYIVEPGS